MTRSDKRAQILTRDNFVTVLGLKKVGSHIRDRKRVDALYQVVVDFVKSKNAVSEVEPSINKGDLSLRIPHTSFHLRLSGLLHEDLKDLVTAFLLYEGLSKDHPALVATGLVSTIMAHFSVLRKKLGESCVVESMGEITPPTTENICLNLTNKICRYPKAACQFMDSDSVCAIDLPASQRLLDDLETRKIVRKIKTTEPQKWAIVV
jgi:hypothetical protein